MKRFRTFIPLYIVAILFGMCSWSIQAHAAGISINDLTTANGWTCNSSKSSCTNNKVDSPYYKGTAKCIVSTTQSPEIGIPDTQEITCTATLATGITSTGTETTDGTGRTTTVGVDTDASGKQTSITSTDNASGGSGGCSFLSGSGIEQCITNIIGYPILAFSALLLGMAGTLFNIIIVKTVFGFSTLIGNAPGLLIAWGILRDLGNMLLLFGFIFMGISTVLNLQTYGVKKALPQLIIFAILLNFSLFTAEAVIDISNGLSSTLYAQSNTAPCATVTGGTTTVQNSSNTAAAGTAANLDTNNNCLNVGIAGSIMSATGLSTLFSADGRSYTLPVFLGLSLFAAIGAVVLFAAAIMIAIRAITLTFVMILSPIGFAGMAIPPLRPMANKWWHALIHQAFFAPIFLLLVLATLKITESFAGTGGNTNLAAALSDPNVSTLSVILVFMLVIGFLIASLMAARSFGAMGASFAIDTATKFVRAPYSGASGFLGRNTLGKGSGYLQSQYQATAGSDTRFGKALRAVSLNTGLDSAIMNVTNAGKKAKYGGKESLEEIKTRKKDRAHALEQEARKAGKKVALEDARDLPSGTPAEIQARNNEVAKVLKNMSVQELEELDDIKHGVEDLVHNLTPEQFSKLMDSSKLNDAEKSHIRTSRYSRLTAAATTGPVAGRVGAIKAITRSMNKEDLESAPAELFTNREFLDSLSDQQRDDLAGSKKRLDSERQAIRATSPNAKLEEAFRDTTVPRATAITNAANMVRDLTAPQIGKIDTAILTTREISQKLTPAMLIALQDAKKLKAGDIQTIANNIRAGGDPASQNFISPGKPGEAYWS